MNLLVREGNEAVMATHHQESKEVNKSNMKNKKLYFILDTIYIWLYNLSIKYNK